MEKQSEGEEERRSGKEKCCLHKRRDSLHNGATAICIQSEIRPLYNGPIKRNNVVY